MPEEQNVRLHLLRSLSRRTDISGILAEHCPLSNAVEQAFRQWFTDIYPAFLRQYFSPVVNIYFRPEGDPDLDARRFLRIEVNSEYINWNDLTISQEIVWAEHRWPDTGVAVLNALTSLPIRHDWWTPEKIMEFVREMFWMGYETEEEFLQQEFGDDWDPENSQSWLWFSEKDLAELKQWERRKTVGTEIHPLGREIVSVCRDICRTHMDVCGFGTPFPECILWEDENSAIGDMIEEYEQEQQQADDFRPHAGGAQWGCETSGEIEGALRQIEAYVREKELLTRALLNFKGGIKKCRKTMPSA